MNSKGRKQRHLMSHERRLEKIKKLNLFSNVFMSVALRDIPACQHVLRTLLEISELKVKAVRTQYAFSKLVSKDAYLDVLAEGAEGKLYNVEIQRADTVDHARRIRYYGAMINSEFLEKGNSYAQMPDVYLIYVSETDLWKHGLATYQVRKNLQDLEEYQDGMGILFVNAEVDDGSGRARLMRYFQTVDPEDLSQGALSDRVRYLKTEQGGIQEMDAVLEEVYQEGKEEGKENERRSMVFRMFSCGDSLESIGFIADMPLAQLEAWEKEWKAEQTEDPMPSAQDVLSAD